MHNDEFLQQLTATVQNQQILLLITKYGEMALSLCRNFKRLMESLIIFNVVFISCSLLKI